ncbi:MAG: arsenate reductase ArsC [Desulfovibrio sp.]|jgi:arsenate reductase
MSRTRVLFVCGQNSARSQMAEALLNHLAGDRYEAHSAGIEPAPINPLAVAELAARGQQFDVVVTVCSKAAGVCPFVPGVSVTERWSFDDPGTVEGAPEERLAKVRAVRNDIEAAITAWVAARTDRKES